MILRNLLDLINDNNQVRIMFFGDSELLGHADILKECLKDDIYEYTVTNIESDCNGEIRLRVEYVN